MTVQDKTVGLGHLTSFEFKFIPRLDLITHGSEDSGLTAKSAGSPERKSMAALVFATALVGTATWLGLQVVARLGRLW